MQSEVIFLCVFKFDTAVPGKGRWEPGKGEKLFFTRKSRTQAAKFPPLPNPFLSSAAQGCGGQRKGGGRGNCFLQEQVLSGQSVFVKGKTSHFPGAAAYLSITKAGRPGMFHFFRSAEIRGSDKFSARKRMRVNF